MPFKLGAPTIAADHVARQRLQLPLLIITKEILGTTTRGYEFLPHAQVTIAVIVAIDEFGVLMHVET
jgi:hypothetical protein